MSRNQCVQTRCCCRNVSSLSFPPEIPVYFLWSSTRPVRSRPATVPWTFSWFQTVPSWFKQLLEVPTCWMSPIPSLDAWVSRDGELRGVLPAEFGPTAGVGADQEDTSASVGPEASLGHLFPWEGCAFTSGKGENLKKTGRYPTNPNICPCAARLCHTITENAAGSDGSYSQLPVRWTIVVRESERWDNWSAAPWSRSGVTHEHQFTKGSLCMCLCLLVCLFGSPRSSFMTHFGRQPCPFVS